MTTEIMNKLQQEYNELIKKYGTDRILWAAAVGATAYNLDFSNTISIAACYLPTEEELYTTLPHFDNNIIDIRELLSLIVNKNTIAIELFLSPYKIINNKYEEILNNEIFINKELLFLSENATLIDNIKKSIKNIILQSFDLPSQEGEFIKQLTKTEKKVLLNIINDFNNNEGDIIVSQATEKYNVSTPVFRTLFYKLKEYQIANVDSRGVRGTHIKFNNIQTLKSLID